MNERTSLPCLTQIECNRVISYSAEVINLANSFLKEVLDSEILNAAKQCVIVNLVES